MPTGIGFAARSRWMTPAGCGWHPPIETAFPMLLIRSKARRYVIPPQGLNTSGNPIYDWSDAVKVMDADTGRHALALTGSEAFEWKMAGDPMRSCVRQVQQKAD
jgi:hypothetical protein